MRITECTDCRRKELSINTWDILVSTLESCMHPATKSKVLVRSLVMEWSWESHGVSDNGEEL